jgi:signal transduction histidine kinase
MSYAELAGFQLTADSPVKRHLQMILQAAKRATDVTGQLLAFGRKQILNPRIFCVNESVMNTSKMLGRLIGEDIILTTYLEADLASTKADPGQVEQIIMNLAVNPRCNAIRRKAHHQHEECGAQGAAFFDFRRRLRVSIGAGFWLRNA